MKYFIKSKLSILCGLVLVASSYGVQAATIDLWTKIDFEELATDVLIDNDDGLLSPNEQQEFADTKGYSTKGYWFGPGVSGGAYDDLHLANASTDITDTGGLLPFNGTVIGSSHDDILLDLESDGTFSIRQFDFAGHIDSEGTVWEADELRVWGDYDGTWTLLRTFNPDGVADGEGGESDFETFCLKGSLGEEGECSGEFSGLSSVMFVHTGGDTHQGSFALDNIYVSSVPVPAAVWLFGSGLLGLVGVSRRRSIK